MDKIKFALTGEEIAQCFPVMAELRPHFVNAEEFTSRVLLQMKEGYKLAYIKDNGEVVSVAGVRILNNLAFGHFLYIDDLVTKSSAKGKGFADMLFKQVVEYAKENNCAELHLDSGANPGRYDAHRFYLKHKMNITSHHFGLKLKK